ncbi:MAG: hypothetical protein IKI21_01225 [Oscillospiraceae bacterium]|nr:hypothetical protein [Oscillospiraceae bacterium]
MDISDILGDFQLSPEAELKFAEKVVRDLKGSVRYGFLLRLLAVLVAVATCGCIIGINYIGEAFGIVIGIDGGFSSFLYMLLLIAALVGCAVWVWSIFRWELTFDGATGFFVYRTLRGGEFRFHVSEIERTYMQSYRFRRSAFVRRLESLVLVVGDREVAVPIRRVFFSKKDTSRLFNSGFTDVEKLSRYIEMYEGTIAPAVRLYEEDTSNDGLSSAVRAAIKEAQAEKEEEMQEIPDVQTADTAAPSESAAETPAPAPSVPKTEKMPAKSAADVDALFDQVLRQYGKNKR